MTDDERSSCDTPMKSEDGKSKNIGHDQDSGVPMEDDTEDGTDEEVWELTLKECMASTRSIW